MFCRWLYETGHERLMDLGALETHTVLVCVTSTLDVAVTYSVVVGVMVLVDVS